MGEGAGEAFKAGPAAKLHPQHELQEADVHVEQAVVEATGRADPLAAGEDESAAPAQAPPDRLEAR